MHLLSWKDLINNLPHVKKATHESDRIEEIPTCFKDTRTSVLEEIKTWISSDDDKCIFWLNGMAGIGKTTIARTIVEEMKENKKILLASFFFSKDDEHAGDYRRVFPTLAHQLAIQHPQIKIALAEIIKSIGDCLDHPLKRQRDELIVSPLKSLNGPRHTVLLIIDALDECWSKDSVPRILQLFLELESSDLCKLRILITSRPEDQIQDLFNKKENLKKVVLHEIDKKIVREDIERYVQNRLQSIFGKQYPLCDNDIKSLVEKCGSLFIYAETALRFIGAKAVKNPPGQLAIVLGSHEDPDAKPYTAIDSLYLQVLTKVIPQDEAIQKQVEKRNAKVIRVIVTLREPLPVAALSTFAGITLIEIQNALDSLQSVIFVPSLPNVPPRIFHPSFIDFITNKERCTDSRFLVDVRSQEISLARRCLELMVDSLGKNMAGMEDEAMLNIDVADSEGRLKEALPSELRYACLHWASHMMATGQVDEKCTSISLLNKFSRGRLLNWMEAMSLLGEVPRAILMMRDIHAWAVSEHWLDCAVTDDNLI